MPERHTRQGLGRGQRFTALDDWADRQYLPSGDPGSHESARVRDALRGAPPERLTGPVIAGPGCWCGRELGHDWPGKAAGAPHPRGEP
jgi:hypothetical protein